MSTRKNTGFTLVELLVVIVIIGILATISIGTFQGYFAQARDAARQSTVNSVSTIVKTSRATESTAQYTLTQPELVAALQANGLETPTESGTSCYVYGHLTTAVAAAGSTPAQPAGSQFFVAARNEQEGASGSLIVEGTGLGVAALNAASGVNGASLDDCGSLPTVTNYTLYSVQVQP